MERRSFRTLNAVVDSIKMVDVVDNIEPANETPLAEQYAAQTPLAEQYVAHTPLAECRQNIQQLLYSGRQC